MGELVFVHPDASYLLEISAYRLEMLVEGSSMDGCGALKRFEDAREWLAAVRLMSDPATVPAGKVPCTQFIYADSDTGEIYGMLQIRNELNEYCKRYVGHIGYSVRPSRRGHGYAKEMLRHALRYCKEQLHMDRVQVSCLLENEASRKTLLACGGKFEERVYEPLEGVWLDKHYINLQDVK